MSQLENNPYKEWILEYGNEEFSEGVNRVLDIIDAWAKEVEQEAVKLTYSTVLRMVLSTVPI